MRITLTHSTQKNKSFMLAKGFSNIPITISIERFVLVNKGDRGSPWQLSILNGCNNKLSLRQIACHVLIFLSVICFTQCSKEMRGVG